VTIAAEAGGVTMGTVDFGGITKEVCLACVPEVEAGDYVIVHAGFAISVIDEREAREVFRVLEEIEAISAQEEGSRGSPAARSDD
jgi:hydrogenase expression/formation protein HypC